MKRVAVLAAVRDELAPTLRALRTSPPAGAAVITRVTGMGPRRVLQALDDLGNVDELVLVGFSAGLCEQAPGGSVHRPRWVIDESGAAIALDGGVPRRVTDQVRRDPMHTLLTLSHVAHSPTAKRELGQRHAAAIADMETYPVACAAAQRGLPLTVIRAVSDSVDMTLPGEIEQWVGDDGRPRPIRAAWYALTHPGSIATLRQLQRNASRGAQAMAGEVMRLLTMPRDAVGQGTS